MGRSEGGALISEVKDTIVEWMEGFERRVNSRDCKVVVAALGGTCSDKRTSGASSMRIIFREGGTEDCEDVSDEREPIASSITVCVYDISVEFSLMKFEGVDCAACAGTGLEMGAASVAAGPLAEAGGCLNGIVLRPGIVVIGDDCGLEAGGSIE